VCILEAVLSCTGNDSLTGRLLASAACICECTDSLALDGGAVNYALTNQPATKTLFCSPMAQNHGGSRDEIVRALLAQRRQASSAPGVAAAAEKQARVQQLLQQRRLASSTGNAGDACTLTFQVPFLFPSKSDAFSCCMHENRTHPSS
jgi:hypothetical protein